MRDSQSVGRALRALAAAIARRQASETDWDERRAWGHSWGLLRQLADELGQEAAVPETPEALRARLMSEWEDMLKEEPPEGS